MKKNILIFGVIILCFYCMVNCMYAYVPKEDSNINYTLIEIGNCTLEISGTEALATAYVKGNSEVISADIEMILQEKSGWTWKNVKKWINHSDSAIVFENEQCTVEKNKTYRLSTTMTVKSNSKSESTVVKSDEKKVK